MPAEFFALLLSPFGRFSYGCDPLDQLPLPSFFPIELEGEQSPLVCLSNFFTIGITSTFISQRLYKFKPFLNSLRHTATTPQKCLVRPDKSFVTERNA